LSSLGSKNEDNNSDSKDKDNGSKDEDNSKDEDDKPKEENKEDCDDSYPDVCIPSPPPDVNCGDISEKNFRVKGSDPHGFDGNDNDGVGCES
jgi:micrococcal nuclease